MLTPPFGWEGPTCAAVTVEHPYSSERRCSLLSKAWNEPRKSGSRTHEIKTISCRWGREAEMASPSARVSDMACELRE